MYLWSSAPSADATGVWVCKNVTPIICCDRSQLFVRELLGESWPDKGSFCVEIQIASVKRVVSPRQKLAEKLKKMTQASFDRVALDEAAKLLDK